MEAHQKIAQVIAEVWQKKDYELLQEYLADPIEWREGPYSKALKSSQDVVRQWRSDLAPQKDIEVKTDVLAIDREKGCYHFSASWADASRGKVEIDGIFLIRLNPAGKIEYFNQWYSIKPA